MAQATVTGSTVKTPIMRAKELIARHQLTAFFALAYAFSWTIWFCVPQIANTAVFGPPFAAVVISAIIAPEKVRGSRAKRWALFALVFAVALSVWVLFTPALATQTFPEPNWYSLWLPGAVSAAVVTFLVSGPLSSRRGVRDLLAPLATWRVDWFSYAAALLLGPALWLLPVGLDLALGGQLPPWPRGVPSLDLVVVAFAWILLFGGGLEEPGWRGFALPRLQSRWSPLVASVILGLLWASWHDAEYFTNPGIWGGPAAFAGIFWRLGWNIPLAIVFTWLYNRSRGSLLILILLHTSFDTATGFIPMSFQAGALLVGTTWVAALVVLVSGRMWRKLQSNAPLAPTPV